MKKLITTTMALLCVTAFSLETFAKSVKSGKSAKSETTLGLKEKNDNAARAQGKAKSTSKQHDLLISARSWASSMSLSIGSKFLKNIDNILSNNATARQDFKVDAKVVKSLRDAVNEVARNPETTGNLMTKPEAVSKQLDAAILKNFKRNNVDKEVIERLKEELCKMG